VPWTQLDYWRVLPSEVRRAVHESLCANDVVSFHTERWRRNFVECCGEWDCTTETTAHPIAVDADEFDALRESADVLAEESRIEASRPELLVVRVDRTDPSKNIVRGFRAFALMLEQHRELVGRVGMLALLDPSRQSLPVYASYVEEIERTVREVNEQFAVGSRRPIDVQIADNFPQSVAAYKQFDVLLVNAVYDGMNLVAKEAPLVNQRGGVVVLSENAGAYEELGEWALGVNPFDLQAQADALFAGLTMVPAERQARAEAIQRHVRAHGIEEWTAAQLSDLDRRASTIIPS
jgi:trehalose 6-phosphate synthase